MLAYKQNLLVQQPVDLKIQARSGVRNTPEKPKLSSCTLSSPTDCAGYSTLSLTYTGDVNQYVRLSVISTTCSTWFFTKSQQQNHLHDCVGWLGCLAPSDSCGYITAIASQSSH